VAAVTVDRLVMQPIHKMIPLKAHYTRIA